MPKAYITTDDKSGLRLLGPQLESIGFSIMASAGSAKALGDRNCISLAPSLSYLTESDDTRHRMVHPDVMAALEANPSDPDHMSDLAGRKIELIDLLVCNLRPFTFDGGDWSGVQLIQTALSGRRVLVVVDPAEYEPLIEAIDKNGRVPNEYRHYLDLRAAAHTSNYLAGYLELRRTSPFPLV